MNLIQPKVDVENKILQSSEPFTLVQICLADVEIFGRCNGGTFSLSNDFLFYALRQFAPRRMITHIIPLLTLKN